MGLYLVHAQRGGYRLPNESAVRLCGTWTLTINVHIHIYSQDKFRGTDLQEGSPPDGISGVDLSEHIEDLVAELYLPLLLGPRQQHLGRVKVHQVVHDVDLKREGEYMECYIDLVCR